MRFLLPFFQTEGTPTLSSTCFHCASPCRTIQALPPSRNPILFCCTCPRLTGSAMLGSADGSPAPPPPSNAFSEIAPALREVMYTYHLISGHVACAAMYPQSSLAVNILHFKLGCGSPMKPEEGGRGQYPIARKGSKGFLWSLGFGIFLPNINLASMMTVKNL